MTTQELEVLIRELLRDIYKAEYIGKLEVTDEGKGFLIKLGMATPEVPIIIYTELKGDKLKKFLKKDLRDRKLLPHDYGYVQLAYFTNCSPVNRKCCDKR